VRCTKQTVELIIGGENDYIVTIKGNQPNLLKTVTELSKSSVAIDTNLHYERLHGRATTREVKVYPILPNLLPDWIGAKSLIEVNRCRTLPDALRLMANQLQLIFEALFDRHKSGVDRSDCQ
jgi:hypothetical protein